MTATIGLRAPLVLSILLAATGCTAKSNTGAGPCVDCNVILISIDTLRADHLSLYGYPRRTSPHLEELARDSVVFRQMTVTGGGTLPSHMSIMTSLLPLTHNVTETNLRRLEDARVTLAEALQGAGFRTAAFADGGYLAARYGFDQGFDLYDSAAGGLARSMPKAQTWLEENRDSRFFLFLHTYDVHSKTEQYPYDCGAYNDYYAGSYPSTFNGCIDGKCASALFLWINDQLREGRHIDEFLSANDIANEMARYDGCINYVDDQLAKLYETLKAAGIFEKTLLIVTSDHGEEFLDHGYLLHDFPYWQHMLYVPLVIKFPYSAYGGTIVDQLVSSIDIMPTILEVLGLQTPGEIQGVSLLPTFKEGKPVRRMVNIYQGVRTEQWKWVPGREGGLFDVLEDPEEHNDLSEERPDLAKRLKSAGEEARKRDEGLYERFAAGVGSEEEPVQLREQELKELRALGYIQ